MSVREDRLTKEQRELQEQLNRSWEGAQRDLADPKFRAYLEQQIERVKNSDAPIISAEEFLAQTEPD